MLTQCMKYSTASNGQHDLTSEERAGLACAEDVSFHQHQPAIGQTDRGIEGHYGLPPEALVPSLETELGRSRA